MKKFILILIIILALGFVSCRSLPPIVLGPNNADDCPAACNRMEALDCPEGRPLADGTTCEQFCVATEEAGHSLNPQCIKTIIFCDEIRTKCGQ